MDTDKWRTKITMEFDALTLMAVHGNVCLGLRHPQNLGPSRRLALDFLTRAEKELVKCGLLDEADIAEIHQVETEETTRLAGEQHSGRR